MSMCMHARCTADEGVATVLQGRLSRRANFVYQYLIRQAWYRWPSGLERGLFYDCCGLTKNFPRSNLFTNYEKEISLSTKTQ